LFGSWRLAFAWIHEPHVFHRQGPTFDLHFKDELAHAEVELLRDHAAHARSVRALERVRLAEVRARGASPPTPPDALLRRQAVRVRLEAAEARRRARVLVAQAHTRAAAEALSSER
jgi:hypothetical protein